MDKINEYLQKNYKYNEIGGMKFPEIVKHIQCQDGFKISVQASSNHYCEPREDEAWPYSAVELGFPSKMDDLIEEYAEEPDTTETVFGWVPIEIVNRLIEKHGGIFIQETES